MTAQKSTYSVSGISENFTQPGISENFTEPPTEQSLISGATTDGLYCVNNFGSRQIGPRTFGSRTIRPNCSFFWVDSWVYYFYFYLSLINNKYKKYTIHYKLK